MLSEHPKGCSKPWFRDWVADDNFFEACIHLIWAWPALYCLNHTDQAPFFRLIVDQEVQELNLLLLIIVVFNSSFNLTTLSSSSFSSSSILQMSTSSARYFGMIMLCDFHIFESFCEPLNLEFWLEADVEREEKKLSPASVSGIPPQCGIPSGNFPPHLEVDATSQMSRSSDWRVSALPIHSKCKSLWNANICTIDAE